MLVREYGLKPVYAPETETGGAGAEPGGAPPAGGTGGAEAAPEPEAGGEAEGQQEQHTGPGSGRSKVRQQLESAAATARKNQTERDKKGQQQSRARQEGLAESPEGQQAPAEPGQQQAPAQQSQVAAPEAWPKEAKAVWAQLPPEVQAAVAKRETDVANGVKSLREAHAEVDTAIAPYMDAIKQHRITPGTAVKQLFGWMDALTKESALLKAGQPTNGAFAALARSYGIDPVRLLAMMVQNPQQQQQQPGQQQGAAQQPQLDPAVKSYLDQALGGVSQHLTGIYSTIQQQNMSKTNEMLGMWSKDKPYYEEVRQHMARLLAPGPNGEPAAVQPLPNGNADLDQAYEMACYGLKPIREKMQAEAAAAEAKKKADAAAAEKAAQKQRTEAARRASGSIPISAPGVPGETGKKQQRNRRSVRDSINDAIKEVTDR